MIGGAVEHELELAADGDELPAFPARRRASAAVRTCRPQGSCWRAAASRMRVSVPSMASFGHGAVGGSHRVGQVVGADEDGVDAGDGVDLVGDLDGLDVLGLDDDEDLVVGVLVVLLGRAAVVDGVQAAADRAVAARGVLGRGDDRAGLVGVHDHRRDDPHRAAVEHHLDVLVLAGGDAGQRDAAGVGDGAEHQGGGLDVGVGVLHVDGQPGKPGARHEPRGDDAPQREPGADLNRASSAESHVATASSAGEKREPNPQGRASESSEAQPSGGLRFTFRVPELRADVGVLPDPNFGLGLAAGLRHHAWRFLASGTFWLAQDHEAGPFLGYGAHFGRVSGELSGCRGFRVSGFELAPCLLLSLDDVSARGTGVGISSTSPQTAWLSLGAGLQGLWSLSRGFGLVFGVSFRVPTSRPHFVSEGVGEIFQVGPVALGIVLGCEGRL